MPRPNRATPRRASCPTRAVKSDGRAAADGAAIPPAPSLPAMYLEKLEDPRPQVRRPLRQHKATTRPSTALGGIRGGCARCTLLFEIWEASLRLNQLIRRFDPNYDDVRKPVPPGPCIDPRQMSLIDD